MSETIGGKYTVQESTRHSQVGIWHAVSSDAGKRQSALLIWTERLPTPEAAQRLAQSIASVGGLRLPGLVNIAERFVDERGVWLISTTAPAPTLAQALNVGISLTPAGAALIATDTGQTLSRLHQSNLAHGEVSARTIVITTSGAALLAETGYAHAIAGTPSGPGNDVMDWARLLRELTGLITDEATITVLRQAADQAEAIGGSAGVNTGIAVIAASAQQIEGFGDRTGLVSMASAVPLGVAAQQVVASSGSIPAQSKPAAASTGAIRGRASVTGSFPVVTPPASQPVAAAVVGQPAPAAPPASPPTAPVPQPPIPQTPIQQPQIPQAPIPQPPVPQAPIAQTPVPQAPIAQAPVGPDADTHVPPAQGGAPAQDLATRMGSRAAQEQVAVSVPAAPPAEVVMRFGQGPPPPTWESALRAQTSQQPVVKRKSTAKKWIMSGLSAGILVMACVIGAYLVATRFLIAGDPMVIESVTIAPAKDPSNTCNLTVDLVATLVTNGEPGTVTFEWIQESNVAARQTTGVQTRSFEGDEKIRQLHLFWQFGGQGTAKATATLKIFDPTVSETKAQFTYTCK